MAASHAVGVGEAVDLLLLGAGLVFLGMDAVEAVRHFSRFVDGALRAQVDHDLDVAGREFAQAVAIIGVDAVIALMTHGAVKAYKGRYRPAIEADPALPAGQGFTNKFGDISYSTAGTATDRALVLHHERVHSFLSPKLLVLHEMRADFAMKGYSRSSLLRYIEEAVAEAYAQMRVHGIKGLPVGIRFPIANGYVTLRAVLTEATVAAGAATIGIAGLRYVVEIEITGP